MNEQILINYTKNENIYSLSIVGDVRKVINKEDETSKAFVEDLKKLIEEYYG